MKEPKNDTELLALHGILRSDPQRYISVVNKWIQDNPNNAEAYFDRHFGWMNVGDHDRALEDMNRAIELEPSPMKYLSRGDVYRHRGQYGKALEDYNRGEAMDPTLWEGDAMGLLYQADVCARLGDETAALAYCARLPNDFWTPGLQGAPAGDKTAIAEALRKIAAAARP
jgi:tetratricopeptide (TPR) repeat protein